MPKHTRVGFKGIFHIFYGHKRTQYFLVSSTRRLLVLKSIKYLENKHKDLELGFYSGMPVLILYNSVIMWNHKTRSKKILGTLMAGNE